MIKKRKLYNQIRTEVGTLGLDFYACFVSGSLFFATENQMPQFLDGQSDIDLLVVCRQTPKNVNIIGHGFPREYDIVNKNLTVKGYNKTLITAKFVSERLFLDITRLKKLAFNSYRRRALSTKKPYALFYCNDKQQPPFVFRYKESGCSGGYKLSYKFNLLKDGKFYLSDIHALFLCSKLIFDNIDAHKEKGLLVERVQNHLSTSISFEDALRTFRYFEDKGILNEEDRRLLAKVFWERDSNLACEFI